MAMYKSVVILVIISTAFAAPPTPFSERIVGGESTVIQEYPYSASLQLQLGVSFSHQCGGSLITTRTILSASHCFYNYNLASIWRIRVGSSFQSSGGQVHYVYQLILHEDYTHHTLVNDVAIMVLATPAILSNSVQPVLIPPAEYNIPDNSIITVIGWGRFWAGGPIPEQLQHADVQLINHQICTDRYYYLNTIQYWPYQVDDGMLCSGILDVGGKDACQGDSGGPVVLKTSQGHVVVGVTSWGNGCADSFYPGVNARTSYYSDWIVKHGSVTI